MVSVEKLKADIDRLHGMFEEKLDEYVKLAPEEEYKQAEILARCHELIDAIGKLQAIRPNPGQEVREGDVGTLTESMMADDTAGFSHRIPMGIEVKVARVEPKFIGFYTGEVIGGKNYFITPLTLEFRRKFRKRGTRKFRVWFTTPTGFERFVGVEATDEGEAKRLAEKQVPAGSEFRYVTEILPVVRRLPTVTIRGKKYYLDARLREYRAVDDPHDRIPLEPEYAKLLGEASVGSAAWDAIIESIIEEKGREARREALPW